MILKKGDIITIDNNEYLIVETSRYGEVDYALGNKLDNEEITQEYSVIEKKGFKFELVENEKVLEILLPIFEKKIQEDVNNYNNKEKYEI